MRKIRYEIVTKLVNSTAPFDLNRSKKETFRGHFPSLLISRTGSTEIDMSPGSNFLPMNLAAVLLLIAIVVGAMKIEHQIRHHWIHLFLLPLSLASLPFVVLS